MHEKYLVKYLDICNTFFLNLKRLMNMNTGITLTYNSNWHPSKHSHA